MLEQETAISIFKSHDQTLNFYRPNDLSAEHLLVKSERKVLSFACVLVWVVEHCENIECFEKRKKLFARSFRKLRTFVYFV